MGFKTYINEALKKVTSLGSTDDFRVTAYGDKYVIISSKERSEEIKVDNIEELEQVVKLLKSKWK